MKYRSQLMRSSRIYDVAGSDALFLRAMREITAHHMLRSPVYARLAEQQGFKLKSLRHIHDIAGIPPLPTLFLKRHVLYSLPEAQMILTSTTSGTSGVKSVVGTDLNSGLYEAGAALRAVLHHHIASPWPTNYIVLSYQPDRENKTGAARTAFLFTLLAPALHREYALVKKSGSDEYPLNADGLFEALMRYRRQGFPVRIVGLPAFLYELLTRLKETGVRMQLHPQSLICFGGGWKQFYYENADKGALYELAREVLGIPEERCHDFYSVVEHPLPYFDCKNHHFHVPVFSRVIIRDPATLQPVPKGTPGILNLLSPLMRSMPLHSLLTDDLAVLHDGAECGCGNPAPYFELLGRAGLQDVKTCAAGAGQFLG